MDKKAVEELLSRVALGATTPEAAAEQLAVLPYSDLGFARLDTHRALRQGFAEVVFCPGKTAEQVIKIVRKLRAHHELVIATRADRAMAVEVLEVLKQELPDSTYLEQPRALVFGKMPEPVTDGPAVCIVTAGTADIPVAEEVALLVVAAGFAVRCVYDVGVAGVHRLLDNLEVLRTSEVTVVIAGMDGALASFVGGLLDKPVIAVPTSIGYGASFGGVAALLSMLSSCAPGVTVVNIDNGFGAAMAALRLLNCLKQSPAQASDSARAKYANEESAASAVFYASPPDAPVSASAPASTPAPAPTTAPAHTAAPISPLAAVANTAPHPAPAPTQAPDHLA